MSLGALGLVVVVITTIYSWATLSQRFARIQSSDDFVTQNAAELLIGRRIDPKLPFAAQIAAGHEFLLQIAKGQVELPTGQQRTQEPQDSFDRLLRQRMEREKAWLMAWFAEAIEADSDLGREAQLLGIEIGLDPNIVERNVGKVRQLMAKKLLDAVDPILQWELINPDYARSAYDDMPNTSTWDRMVGNWEAGKIEAAISVTDIREAVELRKRLHRLPGAGGFLGGFIRTIGRTSDDIACIVAVGVASVVAVLPIAIPLLLWLVALKRWKPKSRAGYATKFSLWPAVFCGWPLSYTLAGPLVCSGFPTWEVLVETLVVGVGLSVLLAVLFFWVGSWLAGKRFSVGAPTDTPHPPSA
jgi:hypothetical protein